MSAPRPYTLLDTAYRLTRAASNCMKRQEDEAALLLVRRAMRAAGLHVKERQFVTVFGKPPDDLIAAERLLDRLLEVESLIRPTTTSKEAHDD